MAALNGLTRPWASFIQTLCAIKESMKFEIVWEDCILEEVRVADREALLIEYDQTLSIHTKRRKQSNLKKDSHKLPKKLQHKGENNQKKYYSKY